MKGFYEDYLSPLPCRSVRGFFALVVIFHHLAQQTAAGSIFHRFEYLGNFPVCVFFFLSGYGLMKKYLNEEDYGRRFLLRRIPPLLFIFFFVLLIFRILYLIMGENISILGLMRLIALGDPILVILWYVPVISIFYLAFGLRMKFFGDSKSRAPADMTFFCIAFILCGTLLGLGQWFFNTCHLIIMGMFWAFYEKSLTAFFRRFYWPSLLVSGGVFLLLFQFFDPIFALWPSLTMRFLITVVRNAFFTLAFILVTMKLRFSNPLLKGLGEISLELYVLHPIPLMLFHSSIINVTNDFVYAVLVLGLSIVLAALVHRPYGYLCSKYQKLIS